MPECPHCGKWFRSNKGLKLHITKTHTTKGPFGRMTDATTFDPIGKSERRSKRRKNRRKKGSLF